MAVTPSGTLTYTTPIPSARTESGQEAAPAAIGALSVYTEKPHPYTGNLIEGWKWDERLWADDTFENRAITLPANWDPTTSGLDTTYFQSGIGSNRDLELTRIVDVPGSGLNLDDVYSSWSPEIQHGWYYDFDEGAYFHSDDSEVSYVTYNQLANTNDARPTASGFNIIYIPGQLKPGIPVTAQRYRWDEQAGKYEVDLDVHKVVTFTGKLSGTSRQSTYSAATQSILWNNVDKSLNEFTVATSGQTTQVIFNKQYVDKIGDYPSGLEILGYYSGTEGQQFHLKYSPVDSGLNVGVYSYTTLGGTIKSWTPIPYERHATLGSGQVLVDYDLGIVEFASPTASGLIVPAVGDTIATTYWRSVRCEYELQNTRDTVLGTEANLNPLFRKSGQGFVYLSTKEEDPVSLELTVELPVITTDVYGPLYIGNNYAAVVATVKDAQDQPLEGIAVDFDIVSEPTVGRFGSFGESVTAITDEDGQARVYFNAPGTITEIGEEVTASGYLIDNTPSYTGVTQTTTLSVEDLLVEGDLEEISLYQVLVDDAVLGLLDVTLDQEDIEAQINEYYRDYFVDQQIFGPTGLTATSGLSTFVDVTSADWEADHRLQWNIQRPKIFAPNQGAGRKLLVATVDSDYLNPHTFTTSAVGPVRPIDVVDTSQGFDIVYDTSIYSIPPPSGTLTSPTGSVWGYFVVSPTSVRLEASLFNRRLNQRISSNEAKLQLKVPPHMDGTWTVDAINENHIDEISSLLSNITASGQKVPLGFRLRSSSVTLAAALNGITFLDKNKPFHDALYDDTLVAGSGIHLGLSVTVSGIVS